MTVTYIADQDTPDTGHICEMVRSMVDSAADPAAICDGFLAGFKLGLTHGAHPSHPETTFHTAYDDNGHEPHRRQATGLTAVGDDTFPADWTLYP